MMMRSKKRRRRKMRRRMRRRVWHSKPHHPRARPSKTHQVKMKAYFLRMMMMRR
jgi:hypothetical protein